MMRARTLIAIWLVSTIGMNVGCGNRAMPQAELPALGGPSALREHATRLGCTIGEPSLFWGDEAFACVKPLTPCGCSLVLKVETAPKRGGGHSITLVKADLIGCPADKGDADLATLLEPIVAVADRSAFSGFISIPRQERNAAQGQRYGAFQTAVFGVVHARSFFGVATATPRRTVWLDRYTPDGIRDLVVDAPAYNACETPNVDGATNVMPRVANDTALGTCDRAPSEAPPCELGAARSRYRSEISTAITLVQSNWRLALHAIGARDRIERGTLVLDERRKHAVVSTLLKQFPTDASGTLDNLGLTLAELAERSEKLMPAPRDDVGYRAYLSTFAAEWSENIVSSLGQLLDRDVELLATALRRDASGRTQQALEAELARAIK